MCAPLATDMADLTPRRQPTAPTSCASLFTSSNIKNYINIIIYNINILC